MATKRKFSNSAVNMLTACGTIVENAIAHKDFLTSKRSTWADPYFPNLKQKIQDAFSTHIGVDSTQQLRVATQTVLALQKSALDNLGDIKVQIEVDFEPTQRKNVLKQLGYTAHYTKAARKNQQALVQLLLTFQQQMIPTLQSELVTKGIAVSLIADTIAQANTLRDANITQETLKSSGSQLTETAIVALNEIYTEVMGVAKIAKRFFRGNKIAQGQFTYTQIMRKMTSIKSQIE